MRCPCRSVFWLLSNSNAPQVLRLVSPGKSGLRPAHAKDANGEVVTLGKIQAYPASTKLKSNRADCRNVQYSWSVKKTSTPEPVARRLAALTPGSLCDCTMHAIRSDKETWPGSSRVPGKPQPIAAHPHVAHGARFKPPPRPRFWPPAPAGRSNSRSHGHIDERGRPRGKQNSVRRLKKVQRNGTEIPAPQPPAPGRAALVRRDQRCPPPQVLLPREARPSR